MKVKSGDTTFTLALSPAQFLDIVSMTVAPIIVIGVKDGRVRAVNTAWLTLFGMRREDIVGKSALDVGEWKDRPFNARLRRLLDDNSPLMGEQFEFVAAGGGIVKGLLSAMGFELDQEAFMLASVVDVSDLRRADDALRQSEEHYRVLAQTMLQGVVHQDAGGAIISMNPAAEKILGKKPADFLGQTSVSVEHDTVREDGTRFPGEDHPAMIALRTGQTVRGIIMGVWNPRESARRWISIDAIPLFRPGESRAYQVYTTFEDITDRRRTEDTLRRQAELLEHAPILVRDMNDEIIMWNSGMERLYGFTRAEALGKVSHTLLQTEFPVSLAEAFGALLNRGTWEGELRHRRRDGTQVRVASLQAFHYDAQGRPEAIIEVNNDITNLRRTEEALRESEERFRSVLEGSRDVVYRFNIRTGVFEYVSPATIALTGYTPAEFAAATHGEAIGMIHPDDRDAWSAAIERALETGTQAVEYRQRTKSGDYIWVSNVMTVTRGLDGQPLYRDGTVRDITQRKRDELALRLSYERLEQRTAEPPGDESGVGARLARHQAAGRLGDELQQVLASAKVHLGAIARDGGEARDIADEMMDLLDQALTISGTLVSEVSPALLQRRRLLPVLNWLAEWGRDTLGVALTITAAEDLPRAREEILILVYRSVKELLFTMADRSDFKGAAIHVRQDGEILSVTVSDRAVPADAPPWVMGTGLLAIKERLSRSGGGLVVSGGPGAARAFTISVQNGPAGTGARSD